MYNTSFNNGINKNSKKNNPTGIYLIRFLFKLADFDSNIIIANKNNTAIAPTYITIKSKAKNSHSKRSNSKDENKKQPTKNNSEKTGCFDKTTSNELNIKKNENNKNNMFESINN